MSRSDAQLIRDSRTPLFSSFEFVLFAALDRIAAATGEELTPLELTLKEVWGK